MNSNGLFPPIAEWGRDIQYASYKRLLIHSFEHIFIRENDDLFEFYCYNKPISKVCICGIVVRFEGGVKRDVIYVDDGSGEEAVRCTRYSVDILGETSVEIGLQGSVGALVVVFGMLELTETNDKSMGLGIKSSVVEVVRDPNYEAWHWLQAAHLAKTVYSVP